MGSSGFDRYGRCKAPRVLLFLPVAVERGSGWACRRGRGADSKRCSYLPTDMMRWPRHDAMHMLPWGRTSRSHCACLLHRWRPRCCARTTATRPTCGPWV